MTTTNPINLASRIAIEESSLGGIFRVVESHADGFLVLGEYDDREVAEVAMARFAGEMGAAISRN